MRLTYIVTTACGDATVAAHRGGGGIYSATLSDRVQFLVNDILPAAVGFDEILVVGRIAQEVKDAFPDVTYIEVPPLRRDRIEAFRQREVATRFSTGDILVLSADDHRLGDSFADNLRELADEDWDIIQPKRLHGITGEELDNGRKDGYSPWHCHVYKRHVWAMYPWTMIDTLWCDIILPPYYKEANFKMIWDDRLEIIDVEAKEHEK